MHSLEVMENRENHMKRDEAVSSVDGEQVRPNHGVPWRTALHSADDHLEFLWKDQMHATETASGQPRWTAVHRVWIPPKQMQIITSTHTFLGQWAESRDAIRDGCSEQPTFSQDSTEHVAVAGHTSLDADVERLFSPSSSQAGMKVRTAWCATRACRQVFARECRTRALCGAALLALALFFCLRPPPLGGFLSFFVGAAFSSSSVCVVLLYSAAFLGGAAVEMN